MKRLLTICVALFACVAATSSLTGHMKNRSFIEKLGYIPEPAVLRAITADHKQLTAAWVIWESMFYYGGLVQASQGEALVGADYAGLEKYFWSAVRLDPYNMDAYYFGQANMVWDAGRVEAANQLLEYGMQYRDWDFYLPMFVGFNYAYFLKNYDKAAYYYRRAGELTGEALFMNLAGRYLQQSGQTDMAIAYLDMMIKGARNDAVRKNLGKRLYALRQILSIEKARDRFLQSRGRLPKTVDELINSGYLGAKPVDPYGGDYFLAEDGQVISTSLSAVKRSSAPPPATK